MAHIVCRLSFKIQPMVASVIIKIKLRSFKSSENNNEKRVGHITVSATQTSSVTL